MSKRRIKISQHAQKKIQQNIVESQHKQFINMERVKNNPLPEGEEGLTLLRTFHECSIPKLTNELQEHINTAMTKKLVNEKSADRILEVGTKAFLGARRACLNKLNKRIICSFDKDEELSSIHNQIKQLDARAEELNKELHCMLEEASKLLDKRWITVVDKYGLNPKKYSYEIDEKQGCINELTLDCETCQSKQVMTSAIKEANNILPKKEGDV